MRPAVRSGFVGSGVASAQSRYLRSPSGCPPEEAERGRTSSHGWYLALSGYPVAPFATWWRWGNAMWVIRRITFCDTLTRHSNHLPDSESQSIDRGRASSAVGIWGRSPAHFQPGAPSNDQRGGVMHTPCGFSHFWSPSMLTH